MAVYVVRRRESYGTVKELHGGAYYVDDEVWIVEADNADQAIKQVTNAVCVRDEELTIAVIIGEEVKQDEDSNQSC